MHYFALIQRIAAQVPLEAATGRDSRRMDVLRISVSKLINAYISETLRTVFRNPTFLIRGVELPIQGIPGNSEVRNAQRKELSF
jgi:hypothetical protein